MKKPRIRLIAMILGAVLASGSLAVGVSEPTHAAACRCYARDAAGNYTSDFVKDKNGNDAKGVQTSTLGGRGVDDNGNSVNCSCDDGNGSGVIHVLELVAEIMTIGVGILGVIGITIVGIQYLTAGGNEEKTRKAKRRMFEIIIGLVVYVVIFSLLNWLIPNFHAF